MGAPASVIDHVDQGFDRAVAELVELSQIPSVSAPGFPASEVARSAEAVAALLRDNGASDVALLRVGDAHPYVVGEWRAANAGAPTLLLYAHHDVQPPGRPGHWHSPAFEPTERDGRLYGRGVVDDKAGIVVFVAAIRAWLAATGGVPVHLKLIVEGEEEIGSTHLEEFLRAHRERLAADVIVLSDTANLDAGLPSLTTSLRGLVNVDVHVRTLDHPLHSGMWGGPVPDAATALAVLLARLVDSQGAPAVPGLSDDVPALSEAERSALAELPFAHDAFRADAGLLAGVELAGKGGADVYERLWRRPAISLTAIDAPPLAGAVNQLVSEVAARVSVRLAPGQSPARVRDLLVHFLESDPPFGAQVRTEVEAAAAGWRVEPVGPAFDAARRALEAGYGRAPAMIGCGGSIPFVEPFAAVLGGVPALLLGLEDPICNAHSENESLLLSDFACAMRAAAHLFAELG